MGIKNYSPRLSPNALTVLRQRYLTKNERGVVIESPAHYFTASRLTSLQSNRPHTDALWPANSTTPWHL